ncbi:hypothetical protein [Piscirickettsia litoralis]|uniref:DUF86 domain-containing protein n=1 Tax=Piscirickettsia litoralis TaxID=1891921 RepID=A0ABX2ZZW9_9GAMM|nr:hypothetical protein [Piscirickettsia litoralis]ODN40928.1 hypothetical protein BGC07_19045 [Piscirickettsia litoralis]
MSQKQDKILRLVSETISEVSEFLLESSQLRLASLETKDDKAFYMASVLQTLIISCFKSSMDVCEDFFSCETAPEIKNKIYKSMSSQIKSIAKLYSADKPNKKYIIKAELNNSVLH